MADFPTSIFSPRTLVNKTGVSYDALNTKVLYAQDLNRVDAEVVAIEETLRKEILTGVKYPRVFGSNLQIGDNDVYTVPTGKKAFIGHIARYYNASGGNIVAYPQVKIGGTYYKINVAVTVPTVSGFSVTGSNGILLNAGEKLSVNVATNNGLNFFVNIIEFDDTVPLSRQAVFGLSNGNNTIYTCPSGKTATLFSGFYLAPLLSVLNSSGASRNYTYYNVISGGSVGSDYQRGSVSGVADNSLSGNTWPENLSAGDFIVVNTSNGASGQFVWCTVWEV